jgi:hypothetical protein
MNTISILGKALLNMQQMSAQQPVHIVLSLPLKSSSQRCIFINTSPMEQRAFVIKKKKDLERESDESEDIMCPSIIEYYILRPTTIDTIFLAEFASSYTKKGTKHKKYDKPYVIRYVKYKTHRH